MLKLPLMKRMCSLAALFLSCFGAFSQSPVHLGVLAGLSNYHGDLAWYNNFGVKKVFHRSKPAVGVTATYEVSDRFSVRGGFTFAKVEGGDKYGQNEFLKETRNLSFQSNIAEFSLLGELTVFNIYNIRWTPYIFGGLAVFHFNPYTYDTTGQKFYLPPLSTEGQGLSAYPDRKPYKLTQLAIPFGAGIKYAINDNVRIGLEMGVRKTLTDYLDDVSGTYVDPSLLMEERGPKAVELSYRGGEVPGGNATYPDIGYPAKGTQRGSPKVKDYYYFTALHLTFRLGGDGSRGSGGGRKKSAYGCPANPM